MNQGGEPGHDDYGLPSVDIQVPDDARDLYRDVQAYHRELRALRRQERSKRWREPLRKGGLILPVIAGFLVLAMIAGMILTMFSANSNLAGIAGQLDGPRFKPRASSMPGGSARASRAAGSTAPAASRTAGRPTAQAAAGLPARRVVLSPRQPFTLQAPTAAVIAVMPSKCRCSGAIRRLLTRARSAGVNVYFDGNTHSGIAALSSLTKTADHFTAVLAIDTHNALARAYSSPRLEILLVDSRGAVTVRSGQQPRFWTTPTLTELKQRR